MLGLASLVHPWLQMLLVWANPCLPASLPADQPGGRRVCLLGPHPGSGRGRPSTSCGADDCTEHGRRGECSGGGWWAGPRLRRAYPMPHSPWPPDLSFALPARLQLLSGGQSRPLPPAAPAHCPPAPTHCPQLVMNVNIREALVISTITNPPAVTQYRVRLYRGPATNSTLVKTVTFTPEQATTVQAINLATLNLPAGTYSAAIQPVGVNGAGPESARSAYIAMQFRRAAARTVRTGRRLVEAQEADAQDSSADNQAGAKDGAPLKRHRNRHLL